MSTPLLRCSNVSVAYGEVVGLRDVSLDVAQGEVIAIIGANGAGKSSLLNGIMRLAKTTGTVEFDGHDISRARASRLTRMGLALVPERRQIFPSLTVEENLLVGANALPRRERRAALAEIYDTFALLAERREQAAGTMSGGQQQIVALARAVISRPKLCLLDEPSLGLAPIWVSELFNEITRLARTGMTIVVVEQLASAALAIADRGYVLEHGRVALEGRAADLLGNAAVAGRYLGSVDQAAAR
jgi:branched-chain amino acid transport system ATP-binding protein